MNPSLIVQIWESLAAGKPASDALDEMVDTLRAGGIDIRLALLVFDGDPTAVIRLADSGEPAAVAELFRCPQNGLQALREWAATATTITLGAARREFRLLARITARANTDDTLLAGIRGTTRGEGILLLDPLGMDLSPVVLGEWCATLLPVCRWAIEQRQKQIEAAATTAELRREFAQVASTLGELRAALGGTRLPLAGPLPAPAEALDDAMRLHIEAALRRTRGRVSGPRGAARLLAINPNTLRARLRKLDIQPRRFATAMEVV